jgi:hypothetical protein
MICVMLFRSLVALGGTAVVVGTGLLAGPAALAAAPGAVQVTGTRLASALLPGSAFGSGYGVMDEQDSGRTLVRSADASVRTASCAYYSLLLGDSTILGRHTSFAFGATAEATDLGWPWSSSTDRSYRQTVYQFASPRIAASVYAQAYAKYASCRTFALSGARFRLESESKTRAGSYQAFQIAQSISYPGSGLPVYGAGTLITVDGADVFIVREQAVRTAPPASTTLTVLTVRLVARVQALR